MAATDRQGLTNFRVLAFCALLAGCDSQPESIGSYSCSAEPVRTAAAPRRWERPDEAVSTMLGKPMLTSGWEAEWYHYGQTFWLDTGSVMSSREAP